MLADSEVKSVNQYLEGIPRFKVDSLGTIVLTECERCSVDATAIASTTAVESFHNYKLFDRIASLTISGSSLSGDLLVALLKPLIFGKCLVELNLSYLTLNNNAIEFLCSSLNKVTGPENQVKRLVLSRCDIGMYNLQKIIYALCENITLQELIITCNNRCNDELLESLKKYILFSRNNLKVLGIGGNQITCRGILELCDILNESTVLLQEIQVNNNNLDDSMTNTEPVNPSQPTTSPTLDKLILSVHSTNKIDTINLSNCNIGSLAWTRYLPFMYTLTTLILSHNRIDDNELVKIGSNLENCVCLRHLDLSYNKFGGLKCCLLQKFFETNQYLFTLNLRGNCLLHAVWKSFSFGLMLNSTLQHLDICNCELTLEDAMVMCFSFTTNEVVHIDMNNNNLPNELMWDPRRYCIDQYRTAATPMPVMNGDVTVSAARSGGNNNRSYLARCPQALADSIPRSRQWRAERISVVQQSVEAFEVATAKREAAAALKAVTEDSSQSLLIYDKPQLSMDVVMMGDSHSQILFPLTPPKDIPKHQTENPANLVYLNNAARVAHTGDLVDKAFFVSLDKMQGMIEEADMANTMEPQTVSISYGRISANMLGTMTLTGFTTYYEAAAFIKPLVAEHLSHLLEATREKLVNGFTLLDPSGNIVPTTEVKLRKIWPEMCTAVAHIKSQHSKDDNIDSEVAAAMTIVVRPANWITLPPE